MTLLQRDPHGAATGRFLPQYGGFMPVRTAQQPPAPTIPPAL
jgi:hypothetical protein